MTPSPHIPRTSSRVEQVAAFVGLFLILTILLPSSAHAIRMRRPFDGWHRISAGYDNNGSAAGCADYACRGRCYNTHTGTDFAMGVGTPIVAVAAGTVSAVNQGCDNYGYYGNTCGGRCGNYVQIRHDDGTHTIYCHMQNGAMNVSNGQRVACGQQLGHSASSGSSTGPHLHLGYKPGSRSIDPFQGSCGGSSSAWVRQNGYDDLPGTECENVCVCSPGASERRGCGRCGTQQRTCGGNCQWGGWGGCTGEGPCAAGSSESRACCDCGSQSRACGGDCRWQAWGGCAGPDPAPLVECPTGRPGVCADGAQRCVDGCLGCVELTPPSDEICDDLDNDCDAETDEGEPTTMGTPPPRFAARVVGYSLPSALPADDRAIGWIALRNEGTEAWEPDAVVVRAEAEEPEDIVALDPDGDWPAWDIPAVLEARVEPGDEAVLAFELAAGTGGAVRFVLTALGVGAMACPDPGVDVDIASLWLGEEDGDEPPRKAPQVIWVEGGTDDPGVDSNQADTGVLGDDVPSRSGDGDGEDGSAGAANGRGATRSGGCSQSGATPDGLPLVALGLLGLAGLLRRTNPQRILDDGAGRRGRR